MPVCPIGESARMQSDYVHSASFPFAVDVVSCGGRIRSRGGAVFRARRLAMARMMITTTSGAPNKSTSSRTPAAPWDSGAKIGEDNIVSRVYQPCTDGSNGMLRRLE